MKTRLVYSYRLFKIFNQREMKVVSISNWNVLSIVMGVVAIEILILMIFQIVSPLSVIGTTMEDEQPWSYTCK